MTNPEIPANVTQIFVAGIFRDFQGRALTSPLVLSPNVTVTINSGVREVALGSPFKAVPDDVTGYVAVSVVATDDPDLNPTNFTYTVTDPAGRKFALAVPEATPVFVESGHPLDGQRVVWLHDAVPAPGPSGGIVQVVTGPAGPQGPAGDVSTEQLDSAIAELPFRADNADVSGAAVGKVPAVTTVSPLTFGLVNPGDVPEYASTAQAAVVGTPTNLVGKVTRYDTSAGAVNQTLPAATAGRVLSIGWDTANADASTKLTLTRAGTDVIGSGSATSFTFGAVGEVITLHCTTAGRWRVTSGHLPSSLYTPDGAPGGGSLIVKQVGDTRAGVINWRHDGDSGHLIHLVAAANMGTGSALVALGMDDSVGMGLLVANKKTARGIVIDQKATITGADAYGLHATQSSGLAPLVRLEQSVTGAAPALQVLALATPSAGQVLASFGNHTGTVGRIYADTGDYVWLRNFELRDKDASTLSRFTARSDEGTAAPHYAYLDRAGVEFRSWAGSATSYYPKRVFSSGNQLKVQGSATVASYSAAATWVDGMVFEFNTGAAKIGFFGAAAVVKPTGTPAAATDPATTQALVNDLRTKLISLGLIA